LVGEGKIAVLKKGNEIVVTIEFEHKKPDSPNQLFYIFFMNDFSKLNL
jgi:hypothetical protein